jgi:phthalate 4,5-dioxygenase oxygenase subunit
MAQESMGTIYDRSQEHLGTSDAMIIRARHSLIGAVKALRERQATPPGVDSPALYRMRSGGALLQKGVKGLEVLKPVHFFQSDTIEIGMEVPVGGS